MVQALRAMRDKGYQTQTLLPHGGQLESLLRQQGFKWRLARFPVLRKSLMRPQALARLLLGSIPDLLRILREIRAEKPSILYVNTLTLPHWLLMGRILGLPVVCHVREAEEGLSRALNSVLMSPLYFADVLLANSDSTARFIAKNGPGLSARTRVLINGFDLPDSPMPVPGTGATRLLIVGRLNPRKGQDVALAAMARLAKDGHEFVLDLVGDTYPGWEWYEDSLKELAKTLGIADRVNFLGFHEKVEGCYQKADIVLVPSRVEPFGNVAVEAMATGRPVIASRVGGLAEIVQHNKTGLLFAVGNSDELADAVLGLLRSPEARFTLAQEAFRSVHARFGFQRFADELTSVFNQLLLDKPVKI